MGAALSEETELAKKLREKEKEKEKKKRAAQRKKDAKAKEEEEVSSAHGLFALWIFLLSHSIVFGVNQ